MIAPLRRRHRIFMTLLLLVLPISLLWIQRSRVPELQMRALPPGLADRAALGGADLESYSLFEDLGVAVRGGYAIDRAVVELVPRAPLAKPDVLIYWAPVPAQKGADNLPEEAVFLGVLADRRRTYAVPSEAAAFDGHLVLYSLAHQEVLASGAIPPLLPLEEESAADEPEESLS